MPQRSPLSGPFHLFLHYHFLIITASLINLLAQTLFLFPFYPPIGLTFNFGYPFSFYLSTKHQFTRLAQLGTPLSDFLDREIVHLQYPLLRLMDVLIAQFSSP